MTAKTLGVDKAFSEPQNHADDREVVDHNSPTSERGLPSPPQVDPTAGIRIFGPQLRLEPLRAWKPALRTNNIEMHGNHARASEIGETADAADNTDALRFLRGWTVRFTPSITLANDDFNRRSVPILEPAAGDAAVVLQPRAPWRRRTLRERLSSSGW